jgi:hypothetical protein
MWGYAEGNETALAIVVGLIILGAIAYVLQRYLRGRR